MEATEKSSVFKHHGSSAALPFHPGRSGGSFFLSFSFASSAKETPTSRKLKLEPSSPPRPVFFHLQLSNAHAESLTKTLVRECWQERNKKGKKDRKKKKKKKKTLHLVLARVHPAFLTSHPSATFET